MLSFGAPRCCACFLATGDWATNHLWPVCKADLAAMARLVTRLLMTMSGAAPSLAEKGWGLMRGHLHEPMIVKTAGVSGRHKCKSVGLKGPDTSRDRVSNRHCLQAIHSMNAIQYCSSRLCRGNSPDQDGLSPSTRFSSCCWHHCVNL